MAFVFRSQKQSVFDNKVQDLVTQKQETISNQQSQLNGTTYINSPDKHADKSLGKLSKGLPSLLRKDKTIEPDLFSFQKQNENSQKNKHQLLKFNLQKLKKATQNYFFSSKVPKNINLIPLKSLNNNLTCSQFTTNLNKLDSEVITKKQISPNNTTSTFVVNKSLINSQTVADFRKTFKQTLHKNQQASKILINCSNQQNGQFRRKCSLPESLQKTTYHSVLKKIKQIKQSNRQKSVDNQSQIFMKTINESNTTSLKRHFTQKKLMKLHKGNLQSSFYKDSQSQESQTQQKIPYGNDLPGPGTYNNMSYLKQKKSFRSKKQKFAKIFGSPLKRFQNDEVKYQEVTYVNEKRKQKLSPNHFFVSKSPKSLEIQKESCSPPLGSYNTRQSIEHDVVRNLLRSSNIPNFNSSMPRFKYPKVDYLPGPGYYNLEALEKIKQQELKNQLNSSYKSQVKRCENLNIVNQNQQKKSEIDIIGSKQGDKALIHKREQHFDSSEFFSPPAFFSSVERFPEPEIHNQGLNSFLKQEKKIVNQETKNNQPFNSSGKRIVVEKVGQGVGVGSYLIQKDQWNKKSYNVNFH